MRPPLPLRGGDGAVAGAGRRASPPRFNVAVRRSAPFSGPAGIRSEPARVNRTAGVGVERLRDSRWPVRCGRVPREIMLSSSNTC